MARQRRFEIAPIRCVEKLFINSTTTTAAGAPLAINYILSSLQLPVSWQQTLHLVAFGCRDTLR